MKFMQPYVKLGVLEFNLMEYVIFSFNKIEWRTKNNVIKPI